jgi:flagellar operon protein
VSGPVVPISPIGGRGGIGPQQATDRPTESRTPFSTVLDQAAERIRLSRHASQRLASRRIELDGVDLARLAAATDQAAAKGSRESLIVMDDLGLIVNVPNRTVVTAMGLDQMAEKVVTNIDSTVFVPRR